MPPTLTVADAFQCSSASRKFLNFGVRPAHHVRAAVSVLFSEPKISQFSDDASISRLLIIEFQCSSASRKFLNCHALQAGVQGAGRFSALQRAENFSILRPLRPEGRVARVSVLFSEPKISQSVQPPPVGGRNVQFQCSSASRKFLNLSPVARSVMMIPCFSALQRAENFSIRRRY